MERGNKMTTTATEHIVNQIRNQIIAGELKSGDKLREVELCGKLNVSRTPLREAFRALQSEGFLIHQPNVGVVVASMDLKELMDLQEVRIQLQIIAARHAALHITDEQIEELKSVNRQLMDAGKRNLFETTDLDVKFHMLIATAAHNATVYEMLMGFYRKAAMITNLLPIHKERLPHTLAEHRNIIEALSLRDPDLAAKYVDIHFFMSAKSFTRKATRYFETHAGSSGG